MINLNQFIEKYQNKNIDFDKKYGSQCVDLIQAYKVEVLGLKPNVFGGSAKTGWQNKLNTFETNFYIKVPNDVNDINQCPPVGSIVFWNYGDYGHVAIVVESKEGEKYFEVFEQNMGDGNGIGYDDRCLINNRSYQNILGWYIPIINLSDKKRIEQLEKYLDENRKKVKQFNVLFQNILIILQEIKKL